MDVDTTLPELPPLLENPAELKSTPPVSESSSPVASEPSPTSKEVEKPTLAPKKRGRKPKSHSEKKAKGKKRKRVSNDDDDEIVNTKKKKKSKTKKAKSKTEEVTEKKKPGRKKKSAVDHPVKRERVNTTSSIVNMPPGSIVTPMAVNEASLAGGTADAIVSFNTICIASFIKPIEALKKLVDYFTFQFSKDEIVGVSEDATHHARAELVMNSKFFNEYTFKGSKRLDLLLPVDFLCDNLKDMRQAHEIDHVFIEATERRLIVHGRNAHFAETSKAEIEAMQRSEANTVISSKSPELKSTAFYPFIIFLSAHRLHRVLTRMDKTLLCKTVTFHWNQKLQTLSITGENNQTRRRGKGSHDFNADNGLIDNVRRYECEDVTMTFDLNYLAKASYAHTVNDVVRIYLSPDNPIVLQYLIKQSHTSPTEDTDLKFWVFPTNAVKTE